MCQFWVTSDQRLPRCAILLVVELEAHSQHRIASFIFPLPHVEQSLAKVAAKVQAHSYVERVRLVISIVIKSLAQLPASLPGLFVGVGSAGVMENPGPVDRAEVG